MNDKELAEFVDLLYPYFIKKMKADSTFKNRIKSTNAKVTWVDTATEKVNNVSVQVSNIGKKVKIKLHGRARKGRKYFTRRCGDAAKRNKGSY